MEKILILMVVGLVHEKKIHWSHSSQIKVYEIKKKTIIKFIGFTDVCTCLKKSKIFKVIVRRYCML